MSDIERKLGDSKDMILNDIQAFINTLDAGFQLAKSSDDPRLAMYRKELPGFFRTPQFVNNVYGYVVDYILLLEDIGAISNSVSARREAELIMKAYIYSRIPDMVVEDCNGLEVSQSILETIIFLGKKISGYAYNRRDKNPHFNYLSAHFLDRKMRLLAEAEKYAR